MRLPVVRLLLSVCALLAVVPAAANAATTTPKVTSVAPLKLKIGDRLTIRGKGFLAGRNRNTVLFKATGSRAVFVKAESATATRIVVKVPAKLLTFLKVRSGQSVATKFQLRVLAKRLSPAYTPAKGSPTIAPAVTTGAAPAGSGATVSTPAVASIVAGTAKPAPAADCDADGILDVSDSDDDNDLLLDVDEAKLGTNPCAADSDGDGLDDGWEYKSAVDLNQRSCPGSTGYPTPCAAALPYPGKRAYPNPMDAGDADKDFDGDGLTDAQEFAAWKLKGTKDPAWHTITNLWYSGGMQASQQTYVDATSRCRGTAVPQVFNGRNNYPEFGLGTTPETYPAINFSDAKYAVYTLDNYGLHSGDGCLDDAERDDDGDLLNNWTELRGPLSNPEWWNGNYGEATYSPRAYAGTEWLDADTDGDGTIDGLDDQDDDDFLNIEEVYRGAKARASADRPSANRLGLWVNPFNPCLPNIRSRTCPPALILGEAAWLPFTRDAIAAPPRWPLYGTSLYGPFHEKDPDVVDPTPNDPSDDVYVDTPAELWSGLPQAQQTNPPLHPLPRP